MNESCPIGASTRLRVGAPVVLRRRRRSGLLALVALAVVLLGGCKLDVRVDAVMAEDGSGTVTVAVGLDEAARSRVGDPTDTFHVQDLRAAGWTVTIEDIDASGITWVRAAKPFATPDEGVTVLTEVTGADGPLRDVSLVRDASVARTDWRFAATVDLTDGPAAFSDPEVAAALGGDPLGGNLAVIEAEEGMPVAEMVDVTVTVDLPSADPQTWHPSFADPQPTALVAESSQLLPVPFLGGEDGLGLLGVGVIGVVVVASIGALMAVRRRYADGR